MFSILLIVIYLSFISLGLPDSLLGAAWPVMQPVFQVPVSCAGILSMIISCGTVISSLLSGKILHRLGTGVTVAGSIFLTAAALFGFSVSSAFWMLCLFAIPYGLGAGAIDAALNHYVALHYASRHMSWLHCFWGVGAAISPYIMSIYLHRGNDWQGGYRTVAVIQAILTAVVVCTLPLWKKTTAADQSQPMIPMKKLLQTRGVIPVLTMFFCYCAVECTAGLWASSYLVQQRGTDAQTAARFASLFYIGITAGRFLSGFVTDRLGDRNMLRLGICGMAAGILLILLPLPKEAALAGLIITGLGAAPIYPSQLHATPAMFGEKAAQSLMGIQMASAYIGTTLMPPLFGLLADRTGMALFPLFLLFFLLILAVCSAVVFRKLSAVSPKTAD